MASRAAVCVGMVAGALLAAAPGASAAEQQAAYDFYVPGQGFQIGLVNASTGVARPLPAGVNTPADELHPTLSPDGHFLVFTRMQLLPKLNGDIPVPAQRNLFFADLQNGQVQQLVAGAGGAGPTFTRHGQATTVFDLTWGIAPELLATPVADGNTRVAATLEGDQFPGSNGGRQATDIQGTANLFVPHAASVRDAFTERLEHNTICTPICSSFRDTRYLTLATFDPLTGALGDSKARLSVVGPPDNASTLAPATLLSLQFGGPGQPAGHAVPRAGDEFVAMDRSVGADSDIHSITFPGEKATTPAPAPITTSDDERLPAWSPDGLQLGFVRTTAGRRKLLVYDLTPGIQAIVNPDIDLGPDAPTPQTRVFQSVWGGLSLSAVPAAPVVACGVQCRAAALHLTLVPTVTVSPAGQKVGIFVVRRTGGTKMVLGIKQPRIKVVGRVPLGTTKKGRNRFAWDGKVAGKRLPPGKYLLTYRLLRGAAVTSVSNTIPFSVKR